MKPARAKTPAGKGPGEAAELKLRLGVVLRVLQSLGSTQGEDAIRLILRAIRETMGFEAVGVRLRKGDDFPYYAVSGFSDEFVKVENCLCGRDAGGKPVLECTCGAVIRGDIDRSLPFVTENGSVWVNSTTGPSEAEAGALKSGLVNFRGTCITSGFESVALIPLRGGDRIIGLLQLNDRRKDMFTLDRIRFFEVLGASIGLALAERETRQALEDSRLFLDSLVENIPNMVFVKGAKNLEFVLFNRAGEELLGQERSALIGKNDYDFFPKEQADFFTAKDRQALAAEGVTDIPEEPIQTGKKGLRLLHTKKLSLRGPDGLPKYLLGISEDITDFKRAEATRDRLAAIVASSDDAIFSKTLDGVIASWNRGAEKIYGYAAAEVLGKNVSLLAPSEQRDEVPSLLEKIRRGEHVDHFETVRVAKDGRRIEVELSLSPLLDESGGIVGASAIARDITERKQAERALREAAELKAQFAAIVSHEMRNPLTAMGMAIDTIRDGSAGPVNLEQAQFMDTAKRNIARLGRLVNEVLDLRALELGRVEFHLEPHDINALVAETVRELQPLAREKGLELVAEPAEGLPKVACDRDKIIQVMANLAGNAVKFSDRGRVTVRTDLLGGRVRVSVRDEGPGIKDEDRGKLFQSFVRLSDTEKRAGGAGLGLAISRKIVGGHGGEIGVDSVYGEGSMFYFVLPAAA